MAFWQKWFDGRPNLLTALLFLGLGLVLMASGGLFRFSPQTTEPPPLTRPAVPPGPLASYEEALAARLEGILTRVEGAGSVWVTVSLEVGPNSIVAVDASSEQTKIHEVDSQGGTRNTTTENQRENMVLQKGAGSDEPLILRTEGAKLAGVLVVAEGAQNPKVAELLTQAVMTNLNLPANRVLVVAGKAGE